MVIPHFGDGLVNLVVYLSYLRSYDNMADAHVKCTNGCGCKYTKLHGYWQMHASLSALQPVELIDFEPGSNCTVQIVHKGGFGPGAKFKLSGFMLTEKDSLLNSAYKGLFGHYAAD